MPDTHTADLCIECPVAGIMETVPAVWEIRAGHTLLIGFRIGGWFGKRADAVAMTGADHVARQERAVFEAWCEADAHDEQNPPEGYRLRGAA